MSANTQSHMMKTTRKGRPFVKDTHDLFATLVVSLQLIQHRSFFKVYPNSFTTDEACSNLGSLKFSQSTRSADPKDPSRIITTTTTTTFSMTRDMAKGICQHFLEAHLIENASDLSSVNFKDRGVYMLTAKGLHILERFITKNGISADHLLPVFATQPICMKLLHLERRSSDDEIIITKSVIEVLFRRFTGKEPNLTKLSDEELNQDYHLRWYNKNASSNNNNNSNNGNGNGGNISELDRSAGIPLRKAIGLDRKNQEEYQFAATSACDWLCDYTTCVGTDEAAEIAAQFVRYGFIDIVSDKGRMRDGNVIVSVKAGGAGGGAGAMTQEAEFRCTDKAIYRITQTGLIAAKWISSPNGSAPSNASTPNLHSQDSSNSQSTLKSHAPAMPSRPSHSSDHQSLHPNHNHTGAGDHHHSEKEGHSKDSHTARLKQILDEPALRSLFREFLRSNFCEENLSFWLDVQDFKRRFNTTSSAAASPAPNSNGAGVTQKGGRGAGHSAMEKHQQDLIAMAFVIYNTYLAPASPAELNIDHNMRAELISYMTQVTQDKDAGIKGHIEPGVGNTLHANQLQNMVKLYERIQTYIFRLMATDSVPKFVKTERFLSLARNLFDFNDNQDEMDGMTSRAANLSIERGVPTNPEDILPSPTKAYLTISQAANEKEAALKEKRSGLA